LWEEPEEEQNSFLPPPHLAMEMCVSSSQESLADPEDLSVTARV